MKQVSICVRFVDGNLLYEKFLAFHECRSGVTGMAIADDIFSRLIHTLCLSQTKPLYDEMLLNS